MRSGTEYKAPKGASFWGHACAQKLANRSIRDVLIVRCNRLGEAIETAWPESLAQTCVAHLIGAAKRFVACGDRKNFT